MDINKIGNSKEFLEILMGCLKSIVFIVDDEVLINDFNDSFIRAFKLTPEEICGRKCGEVLGCVFSQREKKDCGKTSACNTCPIKNGFMKIIQEKKELKKELITLKLYVNERIEERHFFFSARNIKYGDKNMVLAVLDDVTELERSKRLAEKLATLDQLTGINNRRNIFKILNENLQMFKRYKKEFSAIMIDIDNFKEINDNYGHQVGDKVLMTIAKLIKSELRVPDEVGRYGGEEFLVLLPFTNLSKAFRCAERIRLKIERFNIPDIDRKVTVSLGVGEYTSCMAENDFIGNIDRLLYKAKKNGRNRAEI